MTSAIYTIEAQTPVPVTLRLWWDGKRFSVDSLRSGDRSIMARVIGDTRRLREARESFNQKAFARGYDCGEDPSRLLLTGDAACGDDSLRASAQRIREIFNATEKELSRYTDPLLPLLGNHFLPDVLVQLAEEIRNSLLKSVIELSNPLATAFH